jgi:hypothetical protein
MHEFELYHHTDVGVLAAKANTKSACEGTKRMDAEKIAKLTSEQALRNLMANARRLENEAVHRLAFRRLCSLEGMNIDDPLEREFYDVLNAYEELLTEKNGRTTKANRTRLKLKNKGVCQCLIDWTMGPPTDGFTLLIDRGLAELSAEYLVTKHADRFPPEVVEAARKRLSPAGLETGEA